MTEDLEEAIKQDVLNIINAILVEPTGVNQALPTGLQIEVDQNI